MRVRASQVGTQGYCMLAWTYGKTIADFCNGHFCSYGIGDRSFEIFSTADPEDGLVPFDGRFAQLSHEYEDEDRLFGSVRFGVPIQWLVPLVELGSRRIVDPQSTAQFCRDLQARRIDPRKLFARDQELYLTDYTVQYSLYGWHGVVLGDKKYHKSRLAKLTVESVESCLALRD
jgi:hypothetical protein